MATDEARLVPSRRGPGRPPGERVNRVVAELAGARDLRAITEIVVSHAADAVGAAVVSLSLLEGDNVVLAGIHGAQERTPRLWGVHALSAPVPASEAINTGRPVILVGRAEIEGRYPLLADQVPEERSLVVLPVAAGERRLGAIGLVFTGRRAPDDQQLAFLATLADACAQAVDRANALGEAAEQATKLRFLADASAELASSLDYEATLANVARLAVPTLADWCSVQVVERDEIRTLAVAHVDPAKVALARELQKRYPVDPQAPTGAAAVIRTGRSELIPRVTEELLDAAQLDPQVRELVTELQLNSALTVPLAARGRVLGALSLVAAESGRRYDDGDLSFAEDLAHHAALAIDNARLHSEVEQTAVRLQRAVMPEQAVTVPGWDVAVHYSPSANDDVGGDFFDVVPLEGGRLAVVVGDVAGRGVQAAAAMAQMRAAVRSYLSIDPDPMLVLTRLDRLQDRFDIAQLVTLAYLVVDPARGEVLIGNAGHLPGLVVLPDGAVRPLPLPDSVPIGVGGPPRSVLRAPFPAGAVLLAFTDGLVERRGEDIDAGLRRLADAAAALARGELQDTLDSIIAELTSAARDDDVTAVAVRERRAS